jgi:ATP-dependent DNA helicase RecG
MKVNGSPSPVLETDDQCTYFLTVLPVHELASVEASVEGVEVSDIASSMAPLLRYCNLPRTRKEILTH